MPKRKTKCFTMGQRSGIDNILSHQRNWSELPEDVLHLFSKKLPDISDFIRFRAVCKSWQLSAPVNNPPPQLPWLLEYRLQEQCENGILRFYCLSSGKIHTITCPCSRHAWLEGPAYRYLLACRSRCFKRYLRNPLTSDQIYAPDVVNSCGFLPDYIGPDPIEGGDIVVFSRYTNEIVFGRPKTDDWVYVEGVRGLYSANAFYMGQYFTNNEDTGITNVIDIATKKLAYQVALPKDTNPLLKGYTIMVESGGKILRLFKHYEAEPCHFDIHCLYFGDGEGKPCWVKINDIGDQMLFLQNHGGLSFCANNFAGFKGNCIYFLKDGRYLCRYDIEDDSTEVLPCPFNFVKTLFVPSLV